jgi:polyribonucleotide nucleotidyltransferase
MGQKIPVTQSFQMPDGQEVIIETGKLAAQADGSVVVRIGKTMLFCTVCSAKEPREGQDFFPLSVDYQEKFAAAGRIPGNFHRREARLSEYEILICRLVDRAIRPLFPDGYLNETQVIINLISSDEETMPDAYAALAASAALAVSNIPFAEPLSEVRVAKIKDEYLVNPTRSQLKDASMDIIVAATMENIMMVEGEAHECQEHELLEAMKIGHDAIKLQCQAQLELAQKLGDRALNKREFIPEEKNEELYQLIETKTRDSILEIARGGLEKHERKERFKALSDNLVESFKEERDEEWLEENLDHVSNYFDKIKKETIRNMVLTEKVRLDGREFDEVRSIWTEIDYLPSAHGSAIFTRGETQSLTTLTLGNKKDEKLVDNALDFTTEDFILHYNFPGYSVGEVKPMRGPGRREIGHANLAQRSLKNVLPKDLPYTLRIVSDIMESNGSSSMATVCAGSLALMDAGVQITAPVSGIAMGMISDGREFAILSDILGDEDALGDMDFKVTGTVNGICACQMDIKLEGLSYDILEKALMQAKEGRIHIMNEMNKTIDKPREDFKSFAPRVVQLEVAAKFIGAIIGPGGKIIQEMQKETGTEISIEEVDNKGVIAISGTDSEKVQEAIDRIRSIAFEPQEGDVYEAEVVSLKPYGVFVDFKGQSGLLHISEISHSRIDKVEDVLSVGDNLKVKIIGIDKKSGKMRLSRKALIPRPPRKEDN